MIALLQADDLFFAVTRGQNYVAVAIDGFGAIFVAVRRQWSEQEAKQIHFLGSERYICALLEFVKHLSDGVVFVSKADSDCGVITSQRNSSFDQQSIISCCQELFAEVDATKQLPQSEQNKVCNMGTQLSATGLLKRKKAKEARAAALEEESKVARAADLEKGRQNAADTSDRLAKSELSFLFELNALTWAHLPTSPTSPHLTPAEAAAKLAAEEAAAKQLAEEDAALAAAGKETSTQRKAREAKEKADKEAEAAKQLRERQEAEQAERAKLRRGAKTKRSPAAPAHQGGAAAAAAAAAEPAAAEAKTDSQEAAEALQREADEAIEEERRKSASKKQKKN
jgi:hypothetical protein